MENLKKLIKTRYALIIFMVAFGYGCKKTGVAPSSSVSTVAFGVKSDNSVTNLAATNFSSTSLGSSASSSNPVATTPQIKWTAGVANISMFKFEAKRAGVEREFSTANLLNVDLFALTPALVTTNIDTGTYSEIEVKLILTKSSTVLPLMLTGTFVNSLGATVPVELDLNDNLEIKAEAQNVIISSTSNLQSIFLLHLNQISAGITAADLNSAVLTNGKIIISSKSNVALYNKILSNTPNCGGSKFEDGKHSGGNDHGSDG